jgi:hypothetical protein
MYKYKNKYEFVIFIHGRQSQNKTIDSNLFPCVFFKNKKICMQK